MSRTSATSRSSPGDGRSTAARRPPRRSRPSDRTTRRSRSTGRSSRFRSKRRLRTVSGRTRGGAPRLPRRDRPVLEDPHRRLGRRRADGAADGLRSVHDCLHQVGPRVRRTRVRTPAGSSVPAPASTGTAATGSVASSTSPGRRDRAVGHDKPIADPPGGPPWQAAATAGPVPAGSPEGEAGIERSGQHETRSVQAPGLEPFAVPVPPRPTRLESTVWVGPARVSREPASGGATGEGPSITATLHPA